uniref:Uncharacterized protein n=1 Tax=Haptolina brevifila TaxID=156173 RepID=A0A7S2DAW0_9EUKA|mmetsp:Transcript_34783/g.69307  ORF Transcript_34783/g.69307 Transcript_34783/m.69307 type:complete len:219 (+) Transcript_34783:61-717(+)
MVLTRFAQDPTLRQHCVLFDVMDTLVADPFFRGFEQDLFGMSGGIKELFAVKDQRSFVEFECGQISEKEHFETYFVDRRQVAGARVRSYLRNKYEWLPGMKELCTELKGLGVPMGTFSNYPAEWAPLIEEAVGLSELVPWAFVSGEARVRKPAPEAFKVALEIVGRDASEVVFVDDSATNVDAARRCGIASIRFDGATTLKPALFKELGLPISPKAAL